jgi:hypothetical protein
MAVHPTRIYAYQARADPGVTEMPMTSRSIRLAAAVLACLALGVVLTRYREVDSPLADPDSAHSAEASVGPSSAAANDTALTTSTSEHDATSAVAGGDGLARTLGENVVTAMGAKAWLEAELARYPNQYDRVYLRSELNSICSDIRGASDYDVRYVGTPSREWAIKELGDWCRDAPPFTDAESHELKDTLLIRHMGAERTQAAFDDVLSTIRRAEGPGQLFDATLMLISNEPPALRQAMQSAGVGLHEVSRYGLGYAPLLLRCDVAGGCGPRAFETMVYCARHGCREGQGLREALMTSLSPREYQGVQIVYSLIQSIHAGGQLQANIAAPGEPGSGTPRRGR